MLRKIKLLIFYFAKYSGLFFVAKLLFRDRVRVLCYHGFALENETYFLPKLFISPDVFEIRMRFLYDKNYNVQSLNNVVNAIRNKTLIRNAVVITIDDGFYGVRAKAAPILHRFNFPATLYLTSYYFDEDCPIFPLCVNYMFWSSKRREIDISTLNIQGIDEGTQVSLESKNIGDYIKEIIANGQLLPDNQSRLTLLKQLGKILEVDFDKIKTSRILSLINQFELDDLLTMNIDIQSHTHRHQFPLDLDTANEEIKKNKMKIDNLLPAPMQHFCYPSGFWRKEHWEILSKHNIKSATTCNNGLLSNKSHLYAIPRFLDSSDISQIEFESEISGFSELCRLFKFKS